MNKIVYDSWLNRIRNRNFNFNCFPKKVFYFHQNIYVAGYIAIACHCITIKIIK